MAPPPDARPIEVRRFSGLHASEFAIRVRPDNRSADAALQTESVYRKLTRQLADSGASLLNLSCETLLLRDVRDLPAILATRARVLSEQGEATHAPLPTIIVQAPVESDEAFELMASAVVPHAGAVWSVRDVRSTPSCHCEACARSGARLQTLVGQTLLHTTNIHGAGANAYEQACDMFRSARRLLEQCGMGFGDVVRTWIHLRDIDRDYDALNRARREFFAEQGIELRPASTGVQGAPTSTGHDLSLGLLAIQAGGPLDVARMSTPSLNEAWSYGADFSRGLRINEVNKKSLYVSGTASIDESGRSVHLGDFEAQAVRMLDNIESLLAGQGATFADLASGVTYLKNPADAPALRELYRRRGFDGFPCPVVHAPLCRPELLCETEVVAWLRRPPAGA